jgi:flagellar biogenesis protein FliO
MVSKAIQAVSDSMKAQPLALALILINLLFIGAGVWVLRDVALNARERAENESQILAQILRDCAVKKPDAPAR